MEEMCYCKSCGANKLTTEFYRSDKHHCKVCIRLRTLNRRRRDMPPKKGLIYFVLAEEVGRIKIGITQDNLKNRIKGIQGQSPCLLKLLGCISADGVIELALHKQFDCYRHHGEWFEYSEEIKQYVAENATLCPSEAGDFGK